MITEKLEPWLTHNKIEYKIVKEKDIPDEWAHGCTYQGKTFMKHYSCIISNLDSEWLLNFIDELGNMTEEENKDLIS